MRFMPLIFLFGILFNCVCVLVFRLKLDRQYNERFVEYRNALSIQLADFTTNTLYSIDRFLTSNVVARARSDDSAFVSDGDSDSAFSLHRVVGDWDYNYFQISNIDYARVGFRNYRIGDRFPRGGRITAIHADGVEIDGRYWVRNSARSDGRYRSSSYNSDFGEIANTRSYQTVKSTNYNREIDNYERGLDNGL